MVPGLDWALKKQKEMVTETTKVGIVNNVLAYLKDIQSKGQFTYGVAIGLGGNFKYDVRRELITFIMSTAGERAPDPNVLLNYFDSKSQIWSNFVQEQSKITLEEMKNPDSPPIVMTPTIQKDMAMVRPLLETDQSFILVGPEGCGKNLVISNLIKEMKSTQMAVINCNA
jgi:dynein heavy chain 2